MFAILSGAASYLCMGAMASLLGGLPVAAIAMASPWMAAVGIAVGVGVALAIDSIEESVEVYYAY